MTALQNVVLIAGGVLSGVVTGVLFAFVCAVNLALLRLPDRDNIAAMQQVNIAIINPAFLVAFLGAPLSLIAATLLHIPDADTARFWLVLSATAVYVLVGPLGITVAANVPLNKRLDAVDVAASSDTELARVRQWFWGPWQRWNALRTATGVAATVLAFAACLT